MALGWTVTVPAHSLFAPAEACVIAAARVMPGVWGVLGSSSSLRTTLTPCERQSGVDPVVILPQLSSAIAVTSIYACNSHSCQEAKKLEPDQEAGSSIDELSSRRLFGKWVSGIRSSRKLSFWCTAFSETHMQPVAPCALGVCFRSRAPLALKRKLLGGTR